ncbi:hypothetical protein C2G38_855628 [Gigaspora rosea]|uniref:Uncharacterized protein n=1 Tax=Gigaspora rosea TaxID=44941 RepID=A0A397VNC2_9GLOM|nr:hypothetical protein C2G38_855628 [Gigaspora rosea]
MSQRSNEVKVEFLERASASTLIPSLQIPLQPRFKEVKEVSLLLMLLLLNVPFLLNINPNLLDFYLYLISLSPLRNQADWRKAPEKLKLYYYKSICYFTPLLLLRVYSRKNQTKLNPYPNLRFVPVSIDDFFSRLSSRSNEINVVLLRTASTKKLTL